MRSNYFFQKITITRIMTLLRTLFYILWFSENFYVTRRLQMFSKQICNYFFPMDNPKELQKLLRRVVNLPSRSQQLWSSDEDMVEIWRVISRSCVIDCKNKVCPFLYAWHGAKKWCHNWHWFCWEHLMPCLASCFVTTRLASKTYHI